MIFCKCGGLIIAGLCNYCMKGGQVACFNGMTFCTMGRNCGDPDCGRKLTPEIREAADKSGLPFSLANLNDNCFKLKGE